MEDVVCYKEWMFVEKYENGYVWESVHFVKWKFSENYTSGET